MFLAISCSAFSRPAISCLAFSCPAILSAIFMSCNFMSVIFSAPTYVSEPSVSKPSRSLVCACGMLCHSSPDSLSFPVFRSRPKTYLFATVNVQHLCSDGAVTLHHFGHFIRSFLTLYAISIGNIVDDRVWVTLNVIPTFLRSIFIECWLHIR